VKLRDQLVDLALAVLAVLPPWQQNTAEEEPTAPAEEHAAEEEEGHG